MTSSPSPSPSGVRRKAPRSSRYSRRVRFAVTASTTSTASFAATSARTKPGARKATRATRATRAAALTAKPTAPISPGGSRRAPGPAKTPVVRLAGLATAMTISVIGTAVAFGPSAAAPLAADTATATLAVAGTTVQPSPGGPVRELGLSRSLGASGRLTAEVLDDTGAAYRAERTQARVERKAAREKARKIEARKQAKAEAAARAAAREAAAQRAAEEAAARAAEEAALEAALNTTAGTLRDMARREMLAFGYGPEQWPALDALVMRESGWRVTAQNPSSGAYGLPQALPGEKMATEGADWRTNPVTQIRWMLKYVQSRYGSPQNALAHSDRVGWY